jgi:molybdopterin/thiamine biosynthesis adenylyltransferase
MGTLRDSTALLIGAGPLGAPAALALASAGVGRIVLADAAPVEPADLAAQPLLSDADVGRPRDAAVARELARLAPQAAVEVAPTALDARSCARLAAGAAVVVDASSHFATMFLANDAAVAAGRPLVHGGLLHYTLQLLTVLPGASGCLRCLFEGPPPRRPPGAAPEAGVLAPIGGFAGALLAAEAVRLLEGRPGAYAGRLSGYEARTGRSRSVAVRRRPGCPACAALARAAAGPTPAEAR